MGLVGSEFLGGLAEHLLRVGVRSETPGKVWGAFSDVHDIPNDNIIPERPGTEGPGGVCVSRDFGATWKAEAQGIPAKPRDYPSCSIRAVRKARGRSTPSVFDARVFSNPQTTAEPGR